MNEAGIDDQKLVIIATIAIDSSRCARDICISYGLLIYFNYLTLHSERMPPSIFHFASYLMNLAGGQDIKYSMHKDVTIVRYWLIVQWTGRY